MLVRETWGLADLLQAQAVHRGADRAFLMLDAFGEPSDELTFAGLHHDAARAAATLGGVTVPGDRVLLLCGDLNFIRIFFGCQVAGLIAVPASMPTRRGQYLTRVQHIIADSQCSVVVVDESVHAEIAAWLAATELARLPLLKAQECLRECLRAEAEIAPARPQSPISFLQYTSGTTGKPKGVIVTQKNIMANLGLIKAAMDNTANTVGGGWLPLFHDMGLIGLVLEPIYLGIACILMTPNSFLKRPVNWLRAIGTYGITSSGGPNFGFEHAIGRISEAQAQALDLSSWRVCFTGSEPPRHDTMTRFEARFSRYGFRAQAFYPCYGMAETTLFIAGGSPDEHYRRLEVDAAELREGRVVACRSKSPPAIVIGSGQSAGYDLAIVNPTSFERLAAGNVGEIWVRGESVAAGYWQRPDLTRDVFHACIRDEQGAGWLRTGDLGFTQASELYVSGRLKDVIIVNGRNIFPEDIEDRLGAIDRLPADGLLVAFGESCGVGEGVAVLLETGTGSAGDQDWAAVESVVRALVTEDFGASLSAFCVVAKGSILRTTSGKLRRNDTRDLLRQGDLTVTWRAEPKVAAGSRLRAEPIA